MSQCFICKRSFLQPENIAILVHECVNVMKTIIILPRPASGLQVVVSDTKSLTLPEMGDQLQGVQRRVVFVVSIVFIFLNSFFFALLLLYLTQCTIWRLYMAYLSY